MFVCKSFFESNHAVIDWKSAGHESSQAGILKLNTYSDFRMGLKNYVIDLITSEFHVGRNLKAHVN